LILVHSRRSRDPRGRLRSLLTPGDVALIIVLLLASGGSIVVLRAALAAGEYCVIFAGDEEFGRFPLSKDRTVHVPGPLGTTDVVIRQGSVRVVDSPCPHRVCVSMGEKRRSGETVACVPNRVLVLVCSRRGSGVDAITR